MELAVGVGVGVPLGVLSIAMLGAGFWFGRNKARGKGLRNGSGNEVEVLMGSVNGDGNAISMLLSGEQNTIHEVAGVSMTPKELSGRTNAGRFRNSFCDIS
jgi:hypothetical protein